MEIDFKRVAVRASAILTGSYVAGTVLTDVGRYNQLVLMIDFTIGSLSTAEIKIEFSDDDGTSYYQETDETSSVTSNVNTRAVNTVVHQLSATGKHRLAIPIGGENKVKISAKGTGTATSSLLAINAVLSKTYA